MTIGVDASVFHLHSSIDTCSVWHVLSSPTVYSASITAGCSFVMSDFVVYECLFKQRKSPSKRSQKLLDRLRQERKRKRFPSTQLSVDDLQHVEILRQRKSLGLGELSAIALAHKINLAFMTDDQRARKLAQSVLPGNRVQTTPHLLGWLLFVGHLSDSDKDLVVAEHRANDPSNGHLAPYFENIYTEAMRCRLCAQGTPPSASYPDQGAG